MRGSNFNIVSYTKLDGHMAKVVIEDVGPWDRFLTVTNDAEGVVAALYKKGLLEEGTALYYYDSDGIVGRLYHKDGQFTGFAPA